MDFTGYEQHLPPNVVTFTASHVFEETSSDLYPYPMTKGQELLLSNGLTATVCDSLPAFAEEGDAPVLGLLPSGEYVQWTPTILLEANGPSINDAAQDGTNNVLSDGGGGNFIRTKEKTKCSNAHRSFVNEKTCFLSTEPTACSAAQAIGSVMIKLTASNIRTFYDLEDRYVYVVRGLVMESLEEHACRKTSSRWEVKSDATCLAPTQLEAATKAALENAITASLDRNEFTRDVRRTLACDSIDETIQKIDIQIQIGSDCYTHVHPEHLDVYDFTGWTENHPGGAYNIQKWAQGWEDHEGWYLNYPRYGNVRTHALIWFWCFSHIITSSLLSVPPLLETGYARHPGTPHESLVQSRSCTQHCESPAKAGRQHFVSRSPKSAQDGRHCTAF